ncbi:lipoprotein [Klebsiella pneumoniae]|uniref:Lipoprotein n=1 Tax=Klebsiella pneumoniae TaxID=573 RepID=A0A378F3F9_KLEPN|nr:lipoprotein [Klebsiella pneumoniae]
MKSALISPLLAGLLLLTGCAQPAARTGGGGGGTIDASTTQMGDHHFSINGQSGIDIIGPFQGAWRLLLQRARRWTPGMTVRVDWESGVAFARDIPEIPEPAYPNYKGQDNKVWTEEIAEYNQQKRVWYKKIKALKVSTAKPSRCPTITARMCAALRCTFYPAMT